MNLDDIVPPLELCKLIPAGEFEESALYWGELWGLQSVFPRECGDCDTFGVIQTEHIICPAPTLQEIMTELPPLTEAFCSDFCNGEILWMVGESGYEKTPTEAALKFWFMEKGIESGRSKR